MDCFNDISILKSCAVHESVVMDLVSAMLIYF